MANLDNNEKIKLDPDFVAIRSLFLTNSIKTMYQLNDYSPTKVCRLLGMNHGTYIDKLKEPWLFTTFHIIILSSTLEIDSKILLKIIETESEKVISKGYEAYFVRLKKEKARSIRKKKG